MTLSEILKAYSARILSAEEAEHYVGGKANLVALRKHGFVKPWKENHRDVQFDMRDLDLAIDRIKREGWPST